MIDCWNSVVRDNDVVFHLGDVFINAKHGLPSLYALKGVKRLVLGNHDSVNVNVRTYLEAGFEQVFGVTKPAKFPFYLSHIPLHPSSLPQKWCKANIHGHLHGRRVMIKDDYGRKTFDPRYICASVENVCYTPVDLESILEYANNSENIWGKTYCWDEGENPDADNVM